MGLIAGKQAYFYSFNRVDAELTEDGGLSTGNIEYPQFNENFLRGNNSLDTILGRVYHDVDFPFRLGDDGYWEFDSTTSNYSLRLQQDTDGSYYLKENAGNVTSNNNNIVFFPFDDIGTKNSWSNNQMFGMKMELDFAVTSGGKVMGTDRQGQEK